MAELFSFCENHVEFNKIFHVMEKQLRAYSISDLRVFVSALDSKCGISKKQFREIVVKLICRLAVKG